MKKALFLALAAILFSFNARAFDNQHSYYGLSVNVNINFIDEGGMYHQEYGNIFSMPGVDLGFYMQQQLYSRFVLVSGLKYSFTCSDESYSETRSKKTNIDVNTIVNHAITIPVKFGYTGDLPRNWTFTVYAGPSLQFDVATTQRFKNNDGSYEKWDYVNGKYTTNVDGKVGIQSDELKSMKWFDVPLGLGVTFKHKYVGIKAEYEYGILNRYMGEKLTNGMPKWNSHQVSIGAVFTF